MTSADVEGSGGLGFLGGALTGGLGVLAGLTLFSEDASRPGEDTSASGAFDFFFVMLARSHRVSHMGIGCGFHSGTFVHQVALVGSVPRRSHLLFFTWNQGLMHQ